MNTNNSTMTAKSNIRLFGSTRVLVISSLLAAMSIVLGKYLQIPIGDSIRISFENLPILMAGIFFGPFVGAFTGIAADLIGCFMKGYAVNPIITCGAACIGFISGAVYRNFFKDREFPRVTTAIMSAHIIGSMIVKSLGLVKYYHTPMSVIAWRVPLYIIIGIAETAAIYTLLSNKAFMAELERVTKNDLFRSKKIS